MTNKCNLFSKTSEQGTREGLAHGYYVTSNGQPYATDAGRKSAARTPPKLVYTTVGGKMVIAVVVEGWNSEELL